jgi:predicted regulator of Ras-like GTPase activity (Roadblock/LC7/MglB family)
MNCSRFRFLIQQSFDLSLSAQDERMLLAHLDTCDSCARFHHQLEQVIQGAPEVTLPDEYIPNNIEALARQIMEELPQGGGGFLGFFTNLFASLTMKKQEAKVQKVGEDIEETGGNYPHIRRGGKNAEETVRPPKGRQDLEDDLRATSARLKSLVRLQQNSEQKISRSSLSDKFGMSTPQPIKEDSETPLTLAESIRRKVVEEKQPKEQVQEEEWTQTTSETSQADIQQATTTDNQNFGTWGGPSQAAPDQSTNVENSAWGSGEAQPTTDKKQTWSDEAEQIQTGIWSAFQLDDSGLGTPKTSGESAVKLPPRQTGSTPTPKIEPFGPPAVGEQPAASDSSMSERLTNILGNDLTSMAEENQTVDKGGGLFRNLDDKTIDKVFRDNLGINEAIAKPSQTPPPLPGQSAAKEPTPAESPAQPQISSTKNAGLFNLDDSAMDNIFTGNLGINPNIVQSTPATPDAQSAPVPPLPVVPPVPPLPQKIQQAPPAIPPVPAFPQANTRPASAPDETAKPETKTSTEGKSGIFQIDDDAMDKIFADNLGVQDDSISHISMKSAVQTIREASDTPGTPLKIEGIGKLDSKPDTANEAAPGKIAAIGKFLLDQQDLTRIGTIAKEDLSDSKVRVLTLEAAEEINKLLQHISTLPYVVGSVIVGHDGILIANNMPKELDAESIGIWSLAIYVGTTNAIKKIGGHNHLHQLVGTSPQGYLVIADFGGGILVTVSNGTGTDKLIPLMRTITQLVAQ